MVARRIGLEEQISGAAEKGYRTAVIADIGSMERVPSFMSLCARYGIEPIVGAKIHLTAGGVTGTILFLAKDKTGYQQLCRMISVEHGSSEVSAVTLSTVEQAVSDKGGDHLIVIDEGEKGFCGSIVLKKKSLKKEIASLKRKLKGLPVKAGESWKDAVGECNRLLEKETFLKASLKQVPLSDTYQLDFLKKKLKETDSKKKKARDILSQVEEGIIQRDELILQIEQKELALAEDGDELREVIFSRLSSLGKVYSVMDKHSAEDIVCLPEVNFERGIWFPDSFAQGVLGGCHFLGGSSSWMEDIQPVSLQDKLEVNIRKLVSEGKGWDGVHEKRLGEELQALRETGTEKYLLLVSSLLTQECLSAESTRSMDFYPADSFYPGLIVSYVLGIIEVDPVMEGILADLSDMELLRESIKHPRFRIRSSLYCDLCEGLKQRYGMAVCWSSDKAGDGGTVVIGYPDIRDFVPVVNSVNGPVIQFGREDALRMGLFCIDLIKDKYLDICYACTKDTQDAWKENGYDTEVFEKVISQGYLNFIYGCEDMQVQKRIRNAAPGDILSLTQFFSAEGKKSEGKCRAFYRAFMVYRSAYLKWRYPSAYISAYINVFPEKAKSVKYDPICKEIEMVFPDINLSGEESIVENGRVRLGLKHLDCLRPQASEIIRERETNGFFISVEDFGKRLKTGDLEELKGTGVFRNIGGPVGKKEHPLEPPVTARQQTKTSDRDNLVILEGVILKIEEKISKDGSLIASVRIGTSTGEVYAMFFSKAYGKFAEYLKLDAEIRLYGEYVQDKYGTTFSVKEAYPVSNDIYYVAVQDYDVSLFNPYARKCGCPLYLMESSGILTFSGAYFSSDIASVCGVHIIPKI